MKFLLLSLFFCVNIFSSETTKYQSTSKILEFTKKEHLYLKNKKLINLCVDPNWLPYAKVKNGKYIGIGGDIIEIMKSKLPISIKLVNTKSWKETLEFAKQRKCDIVDFAIQTQKRDTYLNFTSQYVKIPLVMATKLNATFIINFKNLQNKKIGIVKDYAFAELLKNKYPNLDLVEVETISAGLDKVKDNELFGYVGAFAAVAHEFNYNFTGELKISGLFDESMQMGLAVRNDDKVLFEIMEKIISNIHKEEISKIISKWITRRYEKEFDYKILVKIFAIALIIVLFLVYRQFILKKQNNSLEELVNEKTQELKVINENLKEKIAIAVEKNNKQQQQLFEQSKITSMAEMIRNIAHHWRQPLNIISTVSSGIKLHHELDIIQSDEELLKNMDLIILNTQHMSETIDIFANFLKNEKIKNKVMLQEVVDFSLNIISFSLKNDHIKLINNIDYSNSEKVFIVEKELVQVIVKIINNAKDILVDRQIENKSIELNLNKQSDSVILTIEDNAGGGIDTQEISKIFEPYFTTKHQSQGTGLELYLCYKIVSESLNGKLSAENTSKGAKFFIELPIA